MDLSSLVKALSAEHALTGLADIVAGNNGLPKVKITTPACSAEIYLHGAQVTSWAPTGSDEVLFLSTQSRFEDGRAIRGGIPICFPWFRDKKDANGKPEPNPKAPAHGVVRTKAWQLNFITDSPDGIIVTLSTQADELSRQWWPYEFTAVHRITVGAKLKLELIVTNTGNVPFTFEEALHTYHAVSDAKTVRVHGLDGVKFLDNTENNREKQQSDDIVFTKQTDNAYLDTKGPLTILDPALKRHIHIDKSHSSTTVVWNPWDTGAAPLADLGNDEWRRFACVEACNIRTFAVTLQPNEAHTMGATIHVEPAS